MIAIRGGSEFFSAELAPLAIAERGSNSPRAKIHFRPECLELISMEKDQKSWKKIVGFWAGVFLVGGAAGVFANQLVLPWLASFKIFEKVSWICQSRSGAMIVNKTEKIYIQEETAVDNILNNSAPAVVGIKSEKKYSSGRSQILAQGSGLILTGDGLIATALNLTPISANKISVLKDNEEWEAKILKKDETNNLVLLKVEKTNLPVANLAENKDLKLGEKIILSGVDFSASAFTRFADLGFVRQVAPLLVQFNEIESIAGAPLINLEGKVLGINALNNKGETEIILSDKIRELMK